MRTYEEPSAKVRLTECDVQKCTRGMEHPAINGVEHSNHAGCQGDGSTPEHFGYFCVAVLDDVLRRILGAQPVSLMIKEL